MREGHTTTPQQSTTTAAVSTTARVVLLRRWLQANPAAAEWIRRDAGQATSATYYAMAYERERQLIASIIQEEDHAR